MFGTKTRDDGESSDDSNSSLKGTTTADRQRQIINVLRDRGGSANKASVLALVDGHTNHVNDAIGMLENKGAIAVEKDVFGESDIVVRMVRGYDHDEEW